MGIQCSRWFWPTSMILLLLVCSISTACQTMYLPITVLSILFVILFTLYPKHFFFLLVVSIPLSFEYHINKSLGLDFPDELFMLLMVGIALLMLAISKIVQLKQFLKHPLFYLLMIQFVWIIASSIHSQHMLLSTKYTLSKIWYLVPFTLVPMLVLKEKKDWITLAYCLILPVLAVAVCTNIRHSNNGFSFLLINEAASPIFRNHVTYAATLSIGFSVLAGIWIQFPSLRKNLYLVISLLVLLFAMYFSYTRGTWVSVVVSLTSTIFFLRKKIITFLVVTLTAITMFTAYMIYDNHYFSLQPDFEHTIIHDNLSDHLDAMYSMKELSTSERFYRWIAAFRMSTKHPMLGFGPSTFYSEYKPFADARFRTYVSANPEKSTVHNYFLLTLVEQGFIGLIILIVLLLVFYVYCQKLYVRFDDPFYKAILLICFLIMTNIVVINFFSDMIETDKVGTFYFMCFGVLILLDTTYKSSKPPSALKP